MRSSIGRARAAFEAQAWDEAFRNYLAAATDGRLDVDGYEQLAVAAYLVGEDGECERAWEGAHRGALETGDRPGAARCA